MVKFKEPSDYDRLETMLQELCKKHGYKLFVAGWTRKTFDIFREHPAQRKLEHLLRIESLATTNGEVAYFSDTSREFAAEVAAELEKQFSLPEATLVKAPLPGY